MTKQEWVDKLHAQGIDVYLDHNVLMLKTSDFQEAKKYMNIMKEYPYSYGIKKIGEHHDEEDILQNDEED